MQSGVFFYFGPLAALFGEYSRFRQLHVADTREAAASGIGKRPLNCNRYRTQRKPGKLLHRIVIQLKVGILKRFNASETVQCGLPTGVCSSCGCCKSFLRTSRVTNPRRIR
jgi:hypothetical protein